MAPLKPCCCFAEAAPVCVRVSGPQNFCLHSSWCDSPPHTPLSFSFWYRGNRPCDHAGHLAGNLCCPGAPFQVSRDGPSPWKSWRAQCGQRGGRRSSGQSGVSIHSRVPSGVLSFFRNHQDIFFFNAIYFASAPSSQGTEFQVVTPQFVKSCRSAWGC